MSYRLSEAEMSFVEDRLASLRKTASPDGEVTWSVDEKGVITFNVTFTPANPVPYFVIPDGPYPGKQNRYVATSE